MQISESSPFQNFTFALKSKDVKRQYPAMLSRFLNFIGLTKDKGGPIEDRCKSLIKK